MKTEPNNIKKITSRQTQNFSNSKRFKLRGPIAGDITGHDPHIVIRSRTKGGTSRYSHTNSIKITEGRSMGRESYVGSRRKDS